MKTNFDDFIRTIPGVRIDEKEVVAQRIVVLVW